MYASASAPVSTSALHQPHFRLSQSNVAKNVESKSNAKFALTKHHETKSLPCKQSIRYFSNNNNINRRHNKNDDDDSDEEEEENRDNSPEIITTPSPYNVVKNMFSSLYIQMFIDRDFNRTEFLAGAEYAIEVK